MGWVARVEVEGLRGGRYVDKVGGRYADERAQSGRRSRGLEAPALSLTGADPPDVAASPAGAGASCRAVDTPSEAAGRPLPEAAEHGQPLGATRGSRSRSVRRAGGRRTPSRPGALPPPPWAGAALPAGAEGRGRRSSRA